MRWITPSTPPGTIATAHATTWQSLVYWNREAYPSLDPEHETYDPNHLSIGWTLRLQPGVVVDYDAINNNEIPDVPLQAGDNITVPQRPF